MGLGKTLQAICIVAGDYQTRKERYKVETKTFKRALFYCYYICTIGNKGC